MVQVKRRTVITEVLQINHFKNPVKKRRLPGRPHRRQPYRRRHQQRHTPLKPTMILSM
jgi:hypothetical protein